jgi:hypothetical protein
MSANLFLHAQSTQQTINTRTMDSPNSVIDTNELTLDASPIFTPLYSPSGPNPIYSKDITLSNMPGLITDEDNETERKTTDRNVWRIGDIFFSGDNDEASNSRLKLASSAIALDRFPSFLADIEYNIEDTECESDTDESDNACVVMRNHSQDFWVINVDAIDSESIGSLSVVTSLTYNTSNLSREKSNRLGGWITKKHRQAVLYGKKSIGQRHRQSKQSKAKTSKRNKSKSEAGYEDYAVIVDCTPKSKTEKKISNMHDYFNQPDLDWSYNEGVSTSAVCQVSMRRNFSVSYISQAIQYCKPNSAYT